MQMTVLISNSKTAWLTKPVMPYLSFQDNFLQDTYIILPKKMVILNSGIKHAKFQFWVPFPFNNQNGTSLDI